MSSKTNSLEEFPMLADVNITGCTDVRFQNIVRKACDFYLRQLLPNRLIRNITIDIEFLRKLDDFADGYCEVTGHNSRKKPREFTIQIQKYKSKRYMLMTLAHEMVHLKQYVLGELDENMNAWKGRRVSSKMSYWDSPWEIEAHGREAGLFTRFCEKYNFKFQQTAVERDN